MTTKELEQIIYWTLYKQGTYLCFEVAMPNPKGRCMVTTERVDLLSYETTGIWRFYELKISKSDFHSKNKATFYGNYNYYVMPKELYDKVKDEIPPEIGCYVASVSKWGMPNCYCIKKPKKQELQISSDKLMFQLMQSLSRENQKQQKTKYKKVLEKFRKSACSSPPSLVDSIFGGEDF